MSVTVSTALDGNVAAQVCCPVTGFISYWALAQADMTSKVWDSMLSYQDICSHQLISSMQGSRGRADDGPATARVVPLANSPATNNFPIIRFTLAPFLSTPFAPTSRAMR